MDLNNNNDDKLEKDLQENIENSDDNNEPLKGIKPDSQLFYCPEYEDVKDNINVIWNKYDIRIQKTLKIMAYWKSFDMTELYQQAYIYFVNLCKIYIPYYEGHFIPFDKFLFKNLIIKLRAYIQNYYVKSKREQPTEICERTVSGNQRNEIVDLEDQLFIKYMYSLINKRQEQILDLTFQGWKQQEIGKKLNISQSRVSVIKKRTINQLKKIMKQKGI